MSTLGNWVRLVEKVKPMKISGGGRIVYGIPLGVRLGAKPGAVSMQEPRTATTVSNDSPLAILKPSKNVFQLMFI